jgi:hypothetical protein
MYYFDTVSDATTDNNGGAHYSVTTGPNIADLPPTPRTVGGYVYYNGTTTGVPNAIVYLTVVHSGQESQLVAVRTNAAGLWSYLLANLRTADFSSYFFPTYTVDDPINVTAQAGFDGTGTLAGTVPAGNALIGNITLDGNPNAVNFSSLTAHSASYAWMPV